ncbi:MAG: hypothetical protein GQ531_10160 [Sulfurovum sp.]|nr:hypothetical protein [Sulfurovum sp.]
MKYITQTLITILLVLSFTGCQDKETEAKIQAAHDAQIAAQARMELLVELEKERTSSPQSEQNEKLKNMGITIDNDIIRIDTNKSKMFLKNFSEKMAKHLQKASDDLHKGVIETKEAGIDISDEHIHIDLNKTRHFLQEWSQQFKVLVDDINEVTSTLENNISN